MFQMNERILVPRHPAPSWSGLVCPVPFRSVHYPFFFVFFLRLHCCVLWSCVSRIRRSAPSLRARPPLAPFWRWSFALDCDFTFLSFLSFLNRFQQPCDHWLLSGNEYAMCPGPEPGPRIPYLLSCRLSPLSFGILSKFLDTFFVFNKARKFIVAQILQQMPFNSSEMVYFYIYIFLEIL